MRERVTPGTVGGAASAPPAGSALPSPSARLRSGIASIRGPSSVPTRARRGGGRVAQAELVGNEVSRGLAGQEGRVLERLEVERNIRLYSGDPTLSQGPPHPVDGLR